MPNLYFQINSSLNILFLEHESKDQRKILEFYFVVMMTWNWDFKESIHKSIVSEKDDYEDVVLLLLLHLWILHKHVP